MLGHSGILSNGIVSFVVMTFTVKQYLLLSPGTDQIVSGITRAHVRI